MAPSLEQTLAAPELALAAVAKPTPPRGFDEASAVDETLISNADDDSSVITSRSEGSAQIGRYIVSRRLGSGAMGVVLAAYDPELDRRVAIKLIRAKSPGEASARSHRRLAREARAMAKLNHPNVVTVHDVGEHEGQVYVAMELVEGDTLERWQAAEVRSWRALLPIYRAAARGLAVAHAAGLVHRDFKPENVMVGVDGRVRVMDFGLARQTEGKKGPDTGELDLGSIVGTPAYMAPEQWSAAPTDARSDQFAFCVALWEALCGERPFPGDSVSSLAFNVLGNRRRELPVQLPSGAPPWLMRVVARGLEQDMDARWPSMDALLAAIDSGFARRRRRRVGLGALAVACLGLGGAFGQGYAERQQLAACEEQGAEIHAVWNDEIGARVESAFAATGASFAGTSAERLATRLDAWTGEWARARTQTCIAAEFGHTLTPELATRAQECLAERRMDLEAFVVELEAADAALVPRAVAGAAGLRSASACAEARYLELRPELLADTADEVHGLRAELARGRALALAGRYVAAVELSTSIVERAAKLGYAPFEAEARAALGGYLVEAGQHAEAEAQLRAAYLGGSGTAPEAAAQAAQELVYLVGHLQARRDEGLVWADAAQVALAIVEPEGGAFTSGLINDRALLEHDAGHLDAALAGYERALAMREAVLGDAHPAIATSLNNMAGVHYVRGETDVAKSLMQRVIEQRTRSFGEDHPLVAASLSNLAVIHRLAGEYEQALVLNEQALVIHREALGPEHPKLASTLNNLGTTNASLGRYAEARDYHEQALAIREASLGPEHPDLAKSSFNLADAELALGQPVEAREHYARSLAIRESNFGREHVVVASSLVGLSGAHLELGEREQAREVLERALAIYASSEHTAALDYADALSKFAELQRRGDELEQAAALYARALDELDADPLAEATHPARALPLLGLGELALVAGDREQARAHAARALALLEAAGTDGDQLEDARGLLERAG